MRRNPVIIRRPGWVPKELANKRARVARRHARKRGKLPIWAPVPPQIPRVQRKGT